MRFVPLPLPGALVAMLAAAYALSGLVGHSPWKSEDAIGIGIVHQFMTGGDWLMPRLAGEPYFEDGPLFYWLGAALAKLLGGLLAAHDAARLACAIALAGTFAFIRLAGKSLQGPVQGNAAILALIGCLGLLVHAHEMAAETGALAGLAAAYWGLALVRDAATPRRFCTAVLATGLGIAVALLCKGPIAGLPLIVTALLLPLVAREWRNRRSALATAAALAVALGACAAWLLALNARSPQLAAGWLLSAFGPERENLPSQLQVLGWAAWPAWPLALWELWRRRHAFAVPSVQLPLLALLASLIAWFGFSSESRDIAALPVLLPLALLAGSAVDALRRGAANALTWFGTMTFTLTGLLIWLGWFAMMTGMPPTIARNFAKLEPGFEMQFATLPFIVAIAVSIGWGWLLVGAVRSSHRSLTFWAGGMTLIWALVMTLWLPWIDYGKTYGGVAVSLKRALPVGAACIQSIGLGEAQRAAFHYHAGIVTLRNEIAGDAQCGLLLVQSGPRDTKPEGWLRVWEGSRPRDRERYRLYTRITHPAGGNKHGKAATPAATEK
jgi:4-amino-4-deoxy-L-arabinose transferase-like glycosyltransferase